MSGVGSIKLSAEVVAARKEAQQKRDNMTLNEVIAEIKAEREERQKLFIKRLSQPHKKSKK